MHAFGVHTHLYRGSPAAVAEAVRRAGLTCVQLTPSFPGLPFHDLDQITPERCQLAAGPFQKAGIAIAAVSSNVRLLEADLDLRHRGIMRWHRLIRHGRDFGTNLLTFEAGVPAAGCPPHQVWSELCVMLEEGLRHAEHAAVQLLLKPGCGHAVGCVEDALRLQEAMAHPCLGFVLDAAGWLLTSSAAQLTMDLHQLVTRLGPRAPLVHAKDLRFEGQAMATPRAGRGVLDYRFCFQLLKPFQPAVPVILEHLRPEEVEETRQFLAFMQNEKMNI